MIHYMEGRYNEAKSELEISLNQFPSAKAFFYLDQVRKKIMEQEQLIPSEPWLSITFPQIQLGDEEPVHIPKGKDVKFHISLNRGAESVTLKARDKLGNETLTKADADILVYNSYSL